MKQKIFAIIGVIAIISTIFASCGSSKEQQLTSTNPDNYEQNRNEYVLEEQDVTDENGEKVTDENGKIVTEQKLVKVENSDSASNNSNDVINIGNLTTTTEKAKETTTIKVVDSTTEPNLTTLPADKNIVPSTDDEGKKVDFSNTDQQIIKQMLEVPYLYESSYENDDGVPINIASHVAIWQMQRENSSTNTFAEGTVVLSLFKYFGQTVINYPNRCNNESSNKNIMFVSDASQNDSSRQFVITNLESKTHTIKINSIENLGNNNYYKVIADVDGVKGIKHLNAVVQKNRLDTSLGFSIKALKWF